MTLQMAGIPGIIEVGNTPLLMGVVNASTDSFSDAGEFPTQESQLELALRLGASGAHIIDIGGETARKALAPITPEEEIRRVVPLIEQFVSQMDTPVSVDTYKLPVAEAAIKAGATIVNDVSGLLDPSLAQLCAETGAALVIMHTRAKPKGTINDPDYYDDVVDDMLSFFTEKIEIACSNGMAFEQIILDPGPDFTKTRAQTIEVLRSLPRILELGRPVLWAVSRKGFLGAITNRLASERLAGSLAALAYGIENGAHIFRVHDVAETADYIAVSDYLNGRKVLPRLCDV